MARVRQREEEKQRRKGKGWLTARVHMAVNKVRGIGGSWAGWRWWTERLGGLAG
jgi:hypothetical protein